MTTTLTPVLRELLDDIAARAPVLQESNNAGTRSGANSFDLENWIKEHFPDAVGPFSWQGGRKWRLPTCPMEASHTNSAAYIVELSNGAIGAGCQHDSCKWAWPELRQKREPGWQRNRQPGSGGGTDLPVNAPTWPAPVDDAAYHGLVGEFVRLVEPHSEADPMALLMQFLVAFGNMIGRRAHFRAEADYHYMNLFAVVVGRTSKGRKGTSLGRVKSVLGQVDPEWGASKVDSGLSSGEGLIWAVRDPIYQRKPKRKGSQDAQVDEMTDAGVQDKRLLMIESEFARTLRVMGGDRNTLSAIVRQAWDGGNLRLITKNSPARATGAHISVVGHITKNELLRELSATDAANGFGNRFLWIACERSKCLPEGGRMDQVDISPLVKRLNAAVAFARTTGEITRDEDATAVWRAVYPTLSEGKPGMSGSLTSRAEAQVMRMACLYALLDSSRVVREEHLLAALAVWEYSERSVGYIFGDALGDPVADVIRHALQGHPNGMTRTAIRDLFAKHKSAASVARALGALLDHGFARREHEQTGGRPSERWFTTESAS